MGVNTNPLEALGEKVRDERIRQRYSLQAAAVAAKVARDTWKRVEVGKSVHDTSRSAVLDLLGLDWKGDPVGQENEPAAELNVAEMMRQVLERNRELERQVQELRQRLPESG